MPFPQRQIHLDFHTAPQIPDVGADWDADHFAQTLQRAHVGSVTVFAKCHHGMNYYPSKIGPVHPSLKFDLLGEQIEALHRAGIRAPIYLSVVWDVSAAQSHPEWRQVEVSGKQAGPGPLDPGWPYLCVNNAYTDELLAQTEELINLYDCDGFFYDILMYHPDGCVCVPCLRQMREGGLDPANSDDRRRNNQRVARVFMQRTTDLIRSRLPDAGIFYNSRWGLQFADEKQYYSQVEIESLPTGGWGYGFYPMWSRFGRTFDLPMLGMTGRFHRTWADWGGLKHPDALRFECGGILATGGAISIGDQLHPRGRLNEAVYEVIAEAFADAAAVEPYTDGATPVVEAALLILAPVADKARQAAGGAVSNTSENIEGASKILLETHRQFDIITDATCADLGKYKLLILADRAAPTQPDTVARLREFITGGGCLLLSHEALLNGDNFALADEMGVNFAGRADSNPDYFRITDPALAGPVTRPGFDYCLYDGPAVRVAPRPDTDILADAYATYFNRTGEHFISHGLTPPLPDKADYPAVTRKGNVVYIYGPVFSAYQKYGNLTFRALIGKCFDLLLPPLLETDAPPSAEVTVMEQREAGRTMVHIVNYSPQRRAPGHVEVLDAPTPLRDVRLGLRLDAPVGRVFLARSGETLPHTVEAGRVVVTVPRVAAHEVVVFAAPG